MPDEKQNTSKHLKKYITTGSIYRTSTLVFAFSCARIWRKSTTLARLSSVKLWYFAFELVPTCQMVNRSWVRQTECINCKEEVFPIFLQLSCFKLEKHVHVILGLWTHYLSQHVICLVRSLSWMYCNGSRSTDDAINLIHRVITEIVRPFSTRHAPSVTAERRDTRACVLACITT